MERTLAVVLGVFFICMFGSLAMESYFKNQCKVAALQSGKSAEQVQQLCK